MKRFESRELYQALAYARAGGQALLVHATLPARAHYLHRRALARDGHVGRLYDRDRARLVETVRLLGQHAVCVECDGTYRQHVDLCGAPLRKALARCEAGPVPPEAPSYETGEG